MNTIENEDGVDYLHISAIADDGWYKSVRTLKINLTKLEELGILEWW